MAFILVLINFISDIDLFVGISNLTNSFHSLCLNFTPESSYPDIYAALVCGEDLKTSELTQNLKNLGIYHVIVVSGSHLVFLSSLIEYFFSSTFLRKFKVAAFPILIIYSLATGFEPPVVRALLSICLNSYQNHKKLFWTQSEVIFISMLLCLLFSDPWKDSYSLLLSYAASIILNLLSKNNSHIKNIGIYFLILPFLLPLSAPSPWSIVSNMTISPLIGLILFPASFLAYFIPYFYFAVDPLWRAVLLLCSLLGPELESFERIPISLNILWILAISMNIYGIFNQKRIL